MATDVPPRMDKENMAPDVPYSMDKEKTAVPPVLGRALPAVLAFGTPASASDGALGSIREVGLRQNGDAYALAQVQTGSWLPGSSQILDATKVDRDAPEGNEGIRFLGKKADLRPNAATSLLWLAARTKIQGADGILGKLAGVILQDEDTSVTGLLVRPNWENEILIVPAHWVTQWAAAVIELYTTAHQVEECTVIQPDSSIRRKFWEALRRARLVDPSKLLLNLDIRCGFVKLEGNTVSFTLKRSAETQAHRVQGVLNVVNKIAVDSDIQAQIEEILRLRKIPYQVKVHLGNVDLKGSTRVPAPWIEGAVQAIKSIRGVREITYPRH